MFGLREDTESVFSDLKDRLRRGRLPSIHANFNELALIGYMMFRLSVARAAHRKRMAEPDAVPIAA